MSFKKLVEEMNTMSKSLPAAEEDIKDDKDASVDDLPAGDEVTDKEIVANADDNEDDDDFSKSLTVTTENGEQVQAFDGEQLIKSFNGKIKKQATDVEQVLTAQNGMIKSLTDIVTSQSKMLKSMNINMQALGNSGKGRKTVINVQEKPDLNKSLDAEDETIQPQVFHQMLSKALKGGAINPDEAVRAETQINSGQNPHPDVVSKVMNFKG